MSHHYSGPDHGFPYGDGHLDLTDLYAFPKPGDIGKSILIMNVHPSTGVNRARPTTDGPFATEAVYELKIDADDAVNTAALGSQSVFLPGDEKAACKAGQPADDARFMHVFAHSLEHTGGYAPGQAKRAAGVLLPDILPFDPSKPACYPAHGRTLTDDAIDVFLSTLTNGKVMRDNVGPHEDLLTSFPYVGSPHKIRFAERVAA